MAKKISITLYLSLFLAFLLSCHKQGPSPTASSPPAAAPAPTVTSSLADSSWASSIPGGCYLAVILLRSGVYDMTVGCVTAKGTYGEYWRGTYQELSGSSLSFAPPTAVTCASASTGGISSGPFVLSGGNLILKSSDGHDVTLSPIPMPAGYNPTATEAYLPLSKVDDTHTAYRGCFGDLISPASFTIMASR